MQLEIEVNDIFSEMNQGRDNTGRIQEGGC